MVPFPEGPISNYQKMAAAAGDDTYSAMVEEYTAPSAFSFGTDTIGHVSAGYGIAEVPRSYAFFL